MGKQNNKAFTLIELLVVIAILGLLASIVLVSVKSARDKAKIAGGLQFSSSVHHALGAYAVGIWDFNENAYNTCEGGEDVCDSSGNGNHGDITGATFVTDTPSGDGYALSFDGNNDHVTANDITSLKQGNSWTMSGWIYARTTIGFDKIAIGKIGLHAGITWVGSTMRFRIFNTVGGGVQIDYIPILNKWYHYVGSFETGTNIVEFYVNGGLVGTDTFVGTMRSYSNTLYIGGSGSSDYHSDVIIDNVRIYDQALSEAQIKQLYVEGVQKYNLVSE